MAKRTIDTSRQLLKPWLLGGSWVIYNYYLDFKKNAFAFGLGIVARNIFQILIR